MLLLKPVITKSTKNATKTWQLKLSCRYQQFCRCYTEPLKVLLRHFAWEYLGTTPKKNSNGTTINCRKWTLNLDQFKISNIQESLIIATFKNYFCHFSRNHAVGTPKNIRNRVIDCRNWSSNLAKFTNSNDFVTSVGNLYR